MKKGNKKRRFLKKNLQDKGVKYIRFYKNTTEISIVYTVCILIDENFNILARGISICSLLDTYNKQKGKSYSYKKAVKALYRKTNDDKINPYVNRWIKNNSKKGSFDSTWNKNNREILKIKKIKDVDEIEKLNEHFKSLDIQLYNKIKLVTATRKDRKSIHRAILRIPHIYPLVVTSKDFDYKSSYKPIPSFTESNIISKIKDRKLKKD